MYNKQPGYCLEGADRTTLSGIDTQHTDDGYCRRENFGGALVKPCSQCGFEVFPGWHQEVEGLRG